jgi:hypothetical protein
VAGSENLGSLARGVVARTPSQERLKEAEDNGSPEDDVSPAAFGDAGIADKGEGRTNHGAAEPPKHPRCCLFVLLGKSSEDELFGKVVNLPNPVLDVPAIARVHDAILVRGDKVLPLDEEVLKDILMADSVRWKILVGRSAARLHVATPPLADTASLP